MARTFLLGVLATLLAAGVWIITAQMQLGAENGLLGVGAGLLLGLIRDHSPLARYGAFMIGLIFGIIALLAGMAGWIGFVVAILLLTVISGLTGGRLPLWAMVLGSGVLAAMYLPFLNATPWYVLTQYPTAFFIVLATSSGGFIAAVLVELIQQRHEEREKESELPQYPQYGTSEVGNPIGGAK